MRRASLTLAALAACVSAAASTPALAQTTLWGMGQRTDRTPLDRRQSNVARPRRPGAPVDAGAADKALPPDTNARAVRPAQAFPPERIQAPSAQESAAARDPAAVPPLEDPRGVEERKDSDAQ